MQTERMRVVVVGAGVAGCGTAALLAHNGIQVTLVESDPFVGGRAATRTASEWGWADERWSEYRPDFGHHALGGNGFFERLLRETGAWDRADIRPLPMAHFMGDGRLHQAPVTFRQSLSAYNYIGLKQKLQLARFDRFARKIDTEEAIQRYGRVPLRRLLADFNLGPQATEIIVEGFAAGYQTTVDLDANSAGDLLLCMKLLRRGLDKHRTTAVLYPHGGFGRLSQALADIVSTHNGEVLLGSRVERITTEAEPTGESRVTGATVDGRHIPADAVIHTAPAFDLGFLLDDQVVDAQPEFFNRVAEGRKASSSLALLICGGPQTLTGAALNTWVFVPRSQLREFSEYLLISELDHSFGVAPVGRQVLTSATLAEGDFDMREFGEKMRRELERLFPGLDLSKAEWTTTRLFPVVDGVARTIDWYGDHRPGPRTPIKGLFIAGDTTQEYSTGTDGCAQSAYLAVEAVLGRDLVRTADVL
ncbi:MAG: FAD-dependent oxidoreductase [Actinomycetota bacterium]